jgi:hypothetical protein
MTQSRKLFSLKLFFVGLFALGLLFLTGCENDNPLYEDDSQSVAVSDLPAAIRTYVEDNYPNQSIEEAERKTECGKEFYEIELTNTEELYFDLDANFLGTDEPYDCDDDDDGGYGYGYDDDDD